MNRRRRWFLCTYALLLCPALAFGEDMTAAGQLAEPVTGDVAIATEDVQGPRADVWILDAVAGEDGALHGTVELPSGSAAVSGKVRGDSVSGTVTDDEGRPVATFRSRPPQKGTGWFASSDYRDIVGFHGEK